MKSLFCFVTLIFFVHLLHAASEESPVSLENILKSVWQHSEVLAGQKTQADLAKGDRFRRFMINEPQFQYSNSDDNTLRSFGISLLIPFPGKSFAFAKVDTAKAHLQSAEFLAKKYELTKTITQVYLDCASAQASFEIQKLTAADLETVAHTLRSLYETGHSTQAEKIGSELQSRQAQFDLVSAEDRQNIFCKKLDALLPAAGESNISFLQSRTTLPDDIDSSILIELGDLTADENRASTAIEWASANYSTALWSQLPDITLSVARNDYLFLPGSPNFKQWTTSYGVSLTLPILFLFHESVEVSRTKSQAQIDQNTAAIQNVVAHSDKLDAAKEYRRSRARLNELRAKDLALAEALVESTYSAYRSGKLGYAELVLSRKTFSDIRNQDIQLRTSIINAHLRCLNQCTSTSEKTL